MLVQWDFAALTFLRIHEFSRIEMSMNAPASMIRLTTQRQIILEELAKVKTHPTASELYDMVRKRLPRIGLGTRITSYNVCYTKLLRMV